MPPLACQCDSYRHRVVVEHVLTFCLFTKSAHLRDAFARICPSHTCFLSLCAMHFFAYSLARTSAAVLNSQFSCLCLFALPSGMWMVNKRCADSRPTLECMCLGHEQVAASASLIVVAQNCLAYGKALLLANMEGPHSLLGAHTLHGTPKLQRCVSDQWNTIT